MLLSKLFAALRHTASTPRPVSAPVEYPLDEEQCLYRAHGAAPVDRHLEIVLGDYRIGGVSFLAMYRSAMAETGTVVTPFNVFQRFETRRQLCQYLLATLDVPGLRAECGVYRGATALLLCRALRTLRGEFDGAGMYLIDSYSGTSRAVERDLIPLREPDGSTRMGEFFPQGKTDITADLVRGFFVDEFPRAQVLPGWIPDVFGRLPESRWSYVHVDVTLFEPTLACLEYFYPRLSPGGAMLCDGSIFCPGAEAAVREFCTSKGIPFVLLGHREYVLLKDAA